MLELLPNQSTFKFPTRRKSSFEDVWRQCGGLFKQLSSPSAAAGRNQMKKIAEWAADRQHGSMSTTPRWNAKKKKTEKKNGLSSCSDPWKQTNKQKTLTPGSCYIWVFGMCQRGRYISDCTWTNWIFSAAPVEKGKNPNSLLKEERKKKQATVDDKVNLFSSLIMPSSANGVRKSILHRGWFRLDGSDKWLTFKRWQTGWILI